ncbi:MAG: CapA family protein [Bacteroidota bacterium]
MKPRRPSWLVALRVLTASVVIGLIWIGLRNCRFAAEPEPAVAPAPVTVTLVAVGDTLVHTPEIAAAWDARAKTYDFRPFFALLRPILSGADLATAVLETTLGGPEGGYTGYPRFNSPDQIAEALQWAGVDVVFTAHNHVMDRGIKGVWRTIETLDRLGLAHVGTARTPDPAARVLLREVRGVKFAFLAYTTSTNGLPVPPAQAWAVNLYDPGRVGEDVAYARRAGAEIVVCAVHYGIEYQRRPDAAQRAVVDLLLAAGVDVVLGSHPHVIQPVELRVLPSPDGGGRTAFIAYSLGNLVSNQRQRYTDCGLLVTLEAARGPGGAVRLTRAQWQPFWVHKYQAAGRPAYRIIPVDATAAAAVPADDPLLTREDRRRMAEVWEETAALLAPTE